MTDRINKESIERFKKHMTERPHSASPPEPIIGGDWFRDVWLPTRRKVTSLSELQAARAT